MLHNFVFFKVQSLGLTSKYKDDEETKKWIRRIAALPLVPVDRIDETFLWLEANAPDITEAPKMYDYLAETWLDGDDALFPM